VEHRERLYRSREDRVLFGVAGGMAEWLDQDPAIIRLLWAVFVVFGGVGLILYVIAAIVIPEEPFETPVMTPQYDPGTTSPTGAMPGTPGAGGAAAPVSGYASPPTRAQRRAARRAAPGPSSGGIVFGVILILVGGWFLLRQFVPWFDFDLLWPLILVGVGVILVVAAVSRPARPAPPAASWPTPAMPAGPSGAPSSPPVPAEPSSAVEAQPSPEPSTSDEPPSA
jgi:phage shock protein C